MNTAGVRCAAGLITLLLCGNAFATEVVLRKPESGANVPATAAVVFQWDAVAGATSYQILICKPAGCGGSDLVVSATVTTPAYTWTTPTPGSYVFSVTAKQGSTPIAASEGRDFWVDDFCSAKLVLGDFDGDARTDRLCSTGGLTRVSRATPSGFMVPAVWLAQTLTKPLVADFNTDGRTDVADFDSATGAFSVALSSGIGFGSMQSWGVASAVSGGTTYNCTGTSAHAGAGDFNADGRTDVYCQIAATATILVGLSNGTGFTFSVFGTGFCDTADLTGTMDMNGDGRDDWFCIGTGNRLFLVFPSNGSSFATTGITAGNAWSCGDAYTYVTGDFNADGKTDVACVGTGSVSLSTGAGFQDQGRSAACDGSEAESLFAADVDGDGQSEIVCNYQGAPADDITVLDWNGAAMVSQAWLGGFCGGQIGAGDFNGDGLTDLLCDSFQAAVAGSPGLRADLLVQATTGLGGATQVSYQPSSLVASEPGTGVRWLATGVTTLDGRGGSSSIGYTFAGGRMDRAERQFLGFSYLRTALPCIGEETECPFSETLFAQDFATAGRPIAVYRRDGSGQLLSAETWTYTTNGTSTPRTSLLTRSDRYAYGPSTTSHTYSTYGHDAYGNVTQVKQWGDPDEPEDDIQADYTYSYNTSAYIVGRVGRIDRQIPGGATLTSELFGYDGLTWSDPPQKGDLTSVRRYLDRTGEYVTRTMVPDAYGNVVSSTDETGITVTTDYDTGFGLFPVATHNAAGDSTTATWDFACGAVLQATDPNQQSTTSTYDVLCRPNRTDLPLGGYTQRYYLDIGDPLLQRTRVETNAATGVSGADWTEARFDGLGRTWREARRGPSTGASILRERAYDARGGVATVTEPFYANETARVTSYTYDALGRVVRTDLPGGIAVTTSYDGDSVTVTDANDNDVTTRYDAYGRPTVVERTLGGQPVQTTSTFDALGRRVALSDPAGSYWAWQYDSLGRTWAEDDPDAGHTEYEYDRAGRLLEQTDAKGQVTTLSYDATVGRLLSRHNAAGTVNYVYSEPRSGYANRGRLTTVSTLKPDQQVLSVDALDYDALGRLVKRQRTLEGTSYLVQKAFDAGGYLLSTTYPDLDTVGPLTYDEAGRLSSIPGIVTSIQYDAAGRPLTRSHGNGTGTTWTYTPDRGLLSAIETTSPGGPVQALHYEEYDSAGMLKRVTSGVAGESWSYDYDELYRMTTATNLTNPADTQSFTYDAAGRIQYNSRVGTYSYPAQGQPRPHAPSAVGGGALVYDDNGNLLTGRGRVLTWDANNLVAQVTAGGTTTAFTYDGFGERVKKVSGSATSLYPMGDDYEITGGVATKYISIEGMGVVAKKVTGGSSPGTYWVHTDRLGSIDAVTDPFGAIVFQRIYRPYGETLAQGGSHTESRGWIDQRNDSETGLTYLHARYFDPQLGTFLSPDPIGVEGGMNQFEYALGDPVNGTDRSGLQVSRCDPEGTICVQNQPTDGSDIFTKIGVFLGGVGGGDGVSPAILIPVVDFLFGGPNKAPGVPPGPVTTPGTIPPPTPIGVNITLITPPEGPAPGGSSGGTGGGSRPSPGVVFITNAFKFAGDWAMSSGTPWGEDPLLDAQQIGDTLDNFEWYANDFMPVVASVAAGGGGTRVFHHNLPQRADLALRFANRGLNIHQFQSRIPLWLHKSLHSAGARGGRWNQAWERFFARYPQATASEMKRFLAYLRRRDGVNKYPMGPR